MPTLPGKSALIQSKGPESGLQSALQSDVAAVRAQALVTLANNAEPDYALGGMAATDVLLAYCADGDPRVRATALECLSNWATFDKHRFDKALSKAKFDWISEHWLQVYVLACKLITEDNAKVRQISLKAIQTLGLRFNQKELQLDFINQAGGSIENASLDPRSNFKIFNTSRRKSLKLADDAFSRICDRLQDPSRYVRETAACLIADLAKYASEENLLITLEKTVMSDRQVKRSVSRISFGGVDKGAVWGPVAAASKRAGGRASAPNQTPWGPPSVDSISLLSTGALGAIINGLEDEFHQVRCATLSTLTQMAAQNARFASLCQDILVDMLTDDIQAVRLLAVTALQTVGDQVPILIDQVAIVTSALAEDNVIIRNRLHDLLSRCRLNSPSCLMSLLDGLLLNLTRYPEDRLSIWSCAAAVGRRHPSFVELCMASLMREHPWLTEPKPAREDPVYITVALLVLNAQPGAPGIADTFSRHLSDEQEPFLRQLTPHLLPPLSSGTSAFSSPSSLMWKPSADVDLPSAKRQRLEAESALVMETRDHMLQFLVSTVEMLGRLTAEVLECLKSNAAPSSHSSFKNVKSQQSEPMEVDGDQTSGCGSSATRSRLLEGKLNRLHRVLSEELRLCQQSMEARGSLISGDLASWLTCLFTAVHCLFSAVSLDGTGKHFPSSTTVSTSVTPSVPNDRGLVLLKRALRLSLKAEHVYLGLTEREVEAVRDLRGTITSLLTYGEVDEGGNSAFPSSSRVAAVVTRLMHACLPTEPEVLAAALSRVFRLRAQLLRPAPLASQDAGGTLGALPEVRFTAMLASAAVTIHALITGLTLEQARERVRVLYRRPDTLDKCQGRYSWQPPSHCWKPFECSLSVPGAEQRPQDSQVTCELQTILELTASNWSSTANVEIGLGLAVPLEGGVDNGVSKTRESLKGPLDAAVAAAAAAGTVISLLPPGVVAKVRFRPMDASFTW